MPDQEQQSLPQGTLDWVETELAQARAQWTKLQQQAEQTQNLVREATERLYRLEEANSGAAPQVAAVPLLEEEIRRQRQQIHVVLEQQSVFEQSFKDMIRARQDETLRLGQELREARHQVELMERAIQAWDQRVNAIEEVFRRSQEMVSQLSRRMDSLAETFQGLESRTNRALEMIKSLETEASRLNGEIDAQQRQGQAVVERVQLYSQQMHKVEERLSIFSSDQTSHQDILDRIELQRVERQRVEEGLRALERTVNEKGEREEELGSHLSILESRVKEQNNLLLGLQQMLSEHRQQMREQLARLAKIQERERHRHMTELEQSLREIRQYGLKLTEE